MFEHMPPIYVPSSSSCSLVSLVETLLSLSLLLVNSLVSLPHIQTHSLHTHKPRQSCLHIILSIYVPGGSESDISKTGFSLAVRKRNEHTDRLGTRYDVNTPLIAHSDTQRRSPTLENISVTFCWHKNTNFASDLPTGLLHTVPVETFGSARAKQKHFLCSFSLCYVCLSFSDCNAFMYFCL